MTTSREIIDYLGNDGNFLGCFPEYELPPFTYILLKSNFVNTN